MPLKREPCRNFQRGSCKYGAQCKFLHVAQQQTNPNVFGFGVQTDSTSQNRISEQEKPNPFGFGVKNNTQSKGGTNYGSKQNQYKPFENTWSRFSPLTTSSSTSSRPTSNQPQAANHKCTDPDSCKRQIVEDFEHERPQWRLTCYGHQKYAPCDIDGDVSYEELRATAYDDAKHGLNLQAMVEKERSLLNAKLIEFDSLHRNPYLGPPSSSTAAQRPILEATSSVSSLSTQNGAPTSVSSFGQPDASHNMGFAMKPFSAASNNVVQQLNPFQPSNQTLSAFGTNNSLLGGAGFGSSLSAQTAGDSFGASTTGFGNRSASAHKAFMPSLASPQFPNSASNQPLTLPNGPHTVLTGVGNGSINNNLMDNIQKSDVSKDADIWLKEIWRRGEIPETPPPDAFV